MKVQAFAVVFGMLVMVGSAGAAESKAQSKDEITRAAMRANKKALVANNMNLSAEQEAIFWPMYDEYQIEINKLNAEREAVIRKFAINYNSLTDELAKELMDQTVEVEKKRNDLRKTLITTFGRKFPPKVVARYYQIENKFDTALMAEAAEGIPLAK